MDGTDAGSGKNEGLSSLLSRLTASAADPALPDALRAMLREACDKLREEYEARHAAEAGYRELFNAVPDPVTILSLDGTVLDFNPAGERLFAREKHHVIGQNIAVLNPDLPPDHIEPVLDTLGRGLSYVIQVTNMRADGTRFPVEVHSANITYHGERGIVAVARDLSARHDAEQRYTALVESVDQGIIIQTRNGQIEHLNSAAMRILGLEPGFPRDPALMLHDWLVVDEDGRPIAPDAFPWVDALRTGIPMRSRTLGLYRRSQDRFRWLRVTSIPQFPLEGTRADRCVSLITDITDLKRQSALFDRVQHLAKVGGWEWDRASDALHLSRGATDILGIAPAPGNLQAFLAAFAAPEADALATAIARAYESRHALSLDLRRETPSGDLWLRLQADFDVFDPTGQRLTGTLQDISERKGVENQLRMQARTDPLTGLLNRDAITDAMRAWLTMGTQPLAVLYIDLDRFKVINDALGHAVGDRLLCLVAERLSGAVRSEGLCARLGGDEFLVVCPLHDETGHLRMADRILQAMSNPVRIDEEEYSVSASIGIATYPHDALTESDLLQNADAAMYESKRRASNGWQLYNQDLARRQREKLQIDNQMRSALANSEMRLLYQPQISLADGRIVGAEALMRWRNAQLGEMSPELFIRHAENTGEIIRLGSWAIQEACRQLREWMEGGLQPVRVAVNVSYRQLLADDLPSTVGDALRAFDVPGHLLELEFTERVLIEDEPDTHHTFARLRELGVMLSIDDFGEGYSGMNYLRRLPIHGLKLSQLFLQDVPGNESNVAVCQAVTGIARSLGLGLVAEGIETIEQRDFLLQLGVPVGQGYLYAPALLPIELAARLARQAIVAA